MVMFALCIIVILCFISCFEVAESFVVVPYWSGWKNYGVVSRGLICNMVKKIDARAEKLERLRRTRNKLMKKGLLGTKRPARREANRIRYLERDNKFHREMFIFEDIEEEVEEDLENENETNTIDPILEEILIPPGTYKEGELDEEYPYWHPDGIDAMLERLEKVLEFDDLEGYEYNPAEDDARLEEPDDTEDLIRQAAAARGIFLESESM